MNNLGQRNSIGLAVIIVGLVLVAQQYLTIPAVWPLAIIIPGIVVLYAGASQQPLSTSNLTVGAAAIVTGLILLYQSITGRWETWSYMWALYPVASGFVLRYAGQHNDNPATQTAGQNTLTSGLLMLAVFGIFFEGFIYQRLSPVLVAGGLVLLGAYLWLTPSEKAKRHE